MQDKKHLISELEAMTELGNRMMIQLAERKWTIARAKKLSQKGIEELFGTGVVKAKYIDKIRREIRESEENIKELKRLIK